MSAHRDIGAPIRPRGLAATAREQAPEHDRRRRHAPCTVGYRGVTMRAIPVLMLLAACGGGSDFAGSHDSVTTVDSTEDGTDTGAGTPTFAEPEASWWSFDAVITVAAGEPQVDGSTVRVFLWDEALQQMCRHEVPVLGATNETPPETTVAPLAWWHLTLGDGAPSVTGCASWPSRDLWLGLAPYDDRLDAEAFEEGWDDLSVYSLLVQEFSAGDVWLVGVGGSVEQWDGSAEALPLPPLPDGEYETHSLYLLALP